MRILQVNEWDLPGRRFNGYDLNQGLEKQGYQTGQFVFQKSSNSSNVRVIPDIGSLRSKLLEVEDQYALPSQLLPYGQVLLQLPDFEKADVVHYHLIHNHMMALPDFPLLTEAKPSVWTWHDPWAVTGHCVHPKNCPRWKTGCTPCPHLGEYFPLRQDYAGELWQIKKRTYEQMDVDIVVSSDFMMDFARNSPLGQCFPHVHKIPFGIQLSQFGCGCRAEAREHFSIPKTDFVIAFRSEEDPYKGTKYAISMLENWKKSEGVTLLVVGTKRLPRKLTRRFPCVQLGWVSDPTLLRDFYTACDVFLMPSVAESFGLMAVEAMASKRPVVCFEGTALPAVTFAPECGVAVPQGDAEALRISVERLRAKPDEARKRGLCGRELAEQNYKFEDYVRRHWELYEEVVERHEKGITFSLT